MAAPNSISCKKLLRLLGTPDCPAIVDISIDPDFADDPFLIPGSFRHPHTDVPGLIAQLDGRRAIITCQRGIKLSQGLVAWLRQDGVDAEYLEGGMYSWRDLPGMIRIPASALPAPVEGTTLWVTRHRPKVDRLACPWLIRRFIDPIARILYVAPSEVMGVAERYQATPFDVPDVPFSDQAGRCSFDAFLDGFALDCPALDRMADVIRAADLDRHQDSPQAAGLLALSVGLSRAHKDDTAQLEAGLPLYDALFSWARDGFEERHGHAA